MKEDISSVLMQHGGLGRLLPELSLTRHVQSEFLFTCRNNQQTQENHRKLAQDLSRKPTEEEIAQNMGITINKLREIIKVAQEPLSLETLSEKKKTVDLATLLKIKMPMLL